MEIADVGPEHEAAFLCCLKTGDDEFAGGVPLKREWYRRHAGKGVRVKLAIDDDGAVAGMVQYSPRPLAPFVVGDDGIWVVHCIWVHLYGGGIGDRSGRGMGTALLRAAEDDMRARGARGAAAWGLTSPVWMNVPWFQHHGYTMVDRQGEMGLAFKAFDPDVDDPRWLRERKRPGPIPGKVRVSSFVIGWCTSGNLIHAWAERTARELGDVVVFESFDTSDPSVVEEWGMTTGIYVDGEEMPIDGTETFEGVREFIAARLPR
jgi:GNAT superfamily N-acetyltransferase